VHTLSKDSHLKETSEDREVNNCFGSLAVIGSAKAGHKRKQCGHKGRTFSPQDMGRVCMGVMSQQLDARHNAILAKRKAAHAMVAGGT